MPKIVIVGSSLAAISAIEAIRAHDTQSEITLFCPEGVLPYDRTLLPSWIAKQTKEARLHPKTYEFFDTHKVKVVLNEQLARISVKRRQLTTESKNHISYEKLLLLDLGEAKLPPIKGNHRKGVYDGYHYKSVKELGKNVAFVDNIVVAVNSFQNLNMACALSALGKEVVVVSKGNGILAEIFDEETAALLKQILEGKGMRVINDNSIEEVLGDTDVKAARLKSGKVIAADMVLLDDAEPQVKMLAETGLTEGRFIPVDIHLKTALNEVYAADALCCGYGASLEETILQGQCAGHNLVSNKPTNYVLPVSSYSFGLDVVEGFAAGAFRLGENGREFLKFDGPQNIYKKVYAQGPSLKGTVLFNAPALKDKILDAIRQAIDVTGQEEALLD
jgi:nitrite reductase (NADH) large subunit